MSNCIEPQFIITFLEEANESISLWETTCLNFKDTNEKESINQLFRIAHNLKGSSASVGLNQFSEFVHKVEEVLTSVKNGEIKFEKDILNNFFEIHTIISNWIISIQNDVSYVNQNFQKNIEYIFSIMEKKNNNGLIGFEIFNQTNSSKHETKEDVILKLNNKIENKKLTSEEYLKVNVTKLDNLINYLGEVIIDQNILRQMSSINSIPKEVKNVISQMSKNIQYLQDTAISLRMTSLDQQFQKMNRVVRDLAVKQKKIIKFESFGSEVELDKIIVDKLTDPLTHLIRNAIDHGIETLEEREKKNKSKESKIELRAIQDEGNVKIYLRDDGRGLDDKKILKKAIEKGLIKEKNNLSKDEIHRVIFMPGFSTKEEITDISGRGVGLDVVSNVIADLKGNIDIETEIDKGTTFIISLPSTLSIIKGLIFKSNKQLFVIPESQVLEIIDHKKIKIENRVNSSQIFSLRNEIIPIIKLRNIFNKNISESQDLNEKFGLLVLHLGKKFSFEVEEIISTQSIVLKKLSEELKGIPGILATTVLGNGEPALVLNLAQLVNIWSYDGA
ncbi:chemotaxis protein CheA [Pigmentibacter ruber]|uniref:chemotaxis protein CheA n=1 Tax=Pigmentibacter ruber TaxID=2683196 RepID=UPI00131C5675|nr:chemotaxis protein CheW [Pigmentibacter ruber]BFD31447.1 hypothetical protein GTC16762_10650 [Pigmentibacter ruber]